MERIRLVDGENADMALSRPTLPPRAKVTLTRSGDGVVYPGDLVWLRLLVENTAGAGKTMGKTAQEVGDILGHVPKPLRARTGYGLDTCHLFSSGYDITASRQALTAVLDEFEESTGEPPSFFHLNDSEGELGANKDRHVLIGDGLIGKAPFEWLMQDQRSNDIPLVLETPQQNYEVGEDDDTPDPYDVKMMKLLESWTSN